MALRIEKLFGMISLAVLGLVAIACVPSKPVVPAAPPIDLEVDAVREVEKINSSPRPSFSVSTGESN